MYINANSDVCIVHPKVGARKFKKREVLYVFVNSLSNLVRASSPHCEEATFTFSPLVRPCVSAPSRPYSSDASKILSIMAARARMHVAPSFFTTSSILSQHLRNRCKHHAEHRVSVGILTQAGHKPSCIAGHLGLNLRAVQRIAARHRATGSTAALPRSGRPWRLIQRRGRCTKRHAKQNRRMRCALRLSA